MKRIIVVGAGAFGRELVCWLENVITTGVERIAGFVDDNTEVTSILNSKYPYPVLGKISDYIPARDDVFVIAIGRPEAKLSIAKALEARGADFFNLIHPTAVVARTAQIGRGVIMCPFALASADSCVADFVTINAYSSIGHDVFVGEGSTLSAHVDITGGARLGSGVFVGTNASVLPGVEIGASATIGAGAVVVRRVPNGATVYAQPAKKL